MNSTVRNNGHEVVIVGGGIAGASLAFGLATAGQSVLVLEATEQFDDRVRGESMLPWGVKEAQTIGVADVLLAAGGHCSGRWRRYGEGSEPRDIPISILVPGVNGTLNLAHPVACQTLLDAAEASGATIERGVTDVRIVGGTSPTICYRQRGESRSATTLLIVGADGRGSAVRRGAGIALHEQSADGFVAGMLVDGLSKMADHDALCDTDNGLFLLFPQGNGRARAYHVVPPALRTRYAGTEGPQRFLADSALLPTEMREVMVNARPAGPCAAFPGSDAWTDRPFVDGVVLIGDAAGHNDPTAGCGLSVAMRDARIVRDLVLNGARRAQDFTSYGTERTERMQKLRLLADVINAACVIPGTDRSIRRQRFDHAMATMDPRLFPLVVGMFTGPEHIPNALVAGTASLDYVMAA